MEQLWREGFNVLSPQLSVKLMDLSKDRYIRVIKRNQRKHVWTFPPQPALFPPTLDLSYTITETVVLRYGFTILPWIHYIKDKLMVGFGFTTDEVMNLQIPIFIVPFFLTLSA